MTQIIAKVTMKVPHRVRSNTSERFAGTSSRVASSERLKPKTRSLKASRRWVKRSPYIGGAGRVFGVDLLLERSGTIPEEYHGEGAILMPTMKAICKACGTQFRGASHGRNDIREGRPARHRHFASALLQRHAGMERRL